MKTQIIHRLAMISLLLLAIRNIIGNLYRFSGEPVELKLGSIFVIAIWSLLLWKIWKQPRGWGLGVGLFLFLLIILHSYLWWQSFSSSEIDILNLNPSVVRFVLYDELPFLITGVLCCMLRFLLPKNEPLHFGVPVN